MFLLLVISSKKNQIYRGPPFSEKIDCFFDLFIYLENSGFCFLYLNVIRILNDYMIPRLISHGGVAILT